MAHLVSTFRGLARRAVSRAVVQTFARPFAANANAPAVFAVDPEDSFVKFTTPEPQAFLNLGILASNETKVGGAGHDGGGRGRRRVGGNTAMRAGTYVLHFGAGPIPTLRREKEETRSSLFYKCELFGG